MWCQIFQFRGPQQIIDSRSVSPKSHEAVKRKNKQDKTGQASVCYVLWQGRSSGIAVVSTSCLPTSLFINLRLHHVSDSVVLGRAEMQHDFDNAGVVTPSRQLLELLDSLTAAPCVHGGLYTAWDLFAICTRLFFDFASITELSPYLTWLKMFPCSSEEMLYGNLVCCQWFRTERIITKLYVPAPTSTKILT
jgi:hypothetical protein